MTIHRYPLILNKRNYSGDGRFTLKIPASITFNKAKLALNALSIPYSWQNIRAAYGNNYFQLAMPIGSGSSVYNITIPDGFYDINGLNAYLQQYCYQNGLYLKDVASGGLVFFIKFSISETYYNVTLEVAKVPTSIGATYQYASGTVGYYQAANLPTTSKNPVVIINDNAFKEITGFDAGMYPPTDTSSTISYSSQNTPNVTPVNSIIVACSAVNNQFCNPPSTLFSFAIEDVTYGSIISPKVYTPSFIDMMDGAVNEISIQFYDELARQLPIKDTNVLIQLLVEQED